MPAVGDRVSFRVTKMFLMNDAPRVNGLTDFAISSSGEDVEPLRQDITSANDLITDIAYYTNELIHIEATIAGTWDSAATDCPTCVVGCPPTIREGHSKRELRECQVRNSNRTAPKSNTAFHAQPAETGKEDKGFDVRLIGGLLKLEHIQEFIESPRRMLRR